MRFPMTWNSENSEASHREGSHYFFGCSVIRLDRRKCWFDFTTALGNSIGVKWVGSTKNIPLTFLKIENEPKTRLLTSPTCELAVLGYMQLPFTFDLLENKKRPTWKRTNRRSGNPTTSGWM